MFLGTIFDVSAFSGKQNRCHQLFGKYFSMFQPFWDTIFDVVVADDNIENFDSTFQFHARTLKIMNINFSVPGNQAPHVSITNIDFGFEFPKMFQCTLWPRLH